MKTIDLHGIKHADVYDIIINACSQHPTPIIVITGKSVHMKRVVSEAALVIDLKTRDAIDNPGRVIIYEDG